ncbi:MAG: tRNA(Ile)(2)-agmatinylcytidine synthase [Candidatus Thermoplasmatota archaeon]|nr:tRNA(Ile)(2)-agmatinylcytidine synthase [Candidatus Thermoplasmatota archaeon]
MWIGIDDTDSHLSGCTTFVAGIILSQIQHLDLNLIGYPRLVRLNPNVPWKTRGNGSVSFQIGKGCGEPLKIGRMHGNDIISYPTIEKKHIKQSFIDRCKELLVNEIYSMAQLEEKDTNPGLVIVEEQFHESLYWEAVRTIVEKDKIVSNIKDQKGWFKEFKNGRGIIGATAGIAWRGVHDNTYELITYRKKDRWGTTRYIDEDSVIKMDKQIPLTFDNFDYEEHQINIMPHSPCPVLYGVRAESASVLPACMKIIQTEFFDDWLIFLSNQGTDDHLVPSSINKVYPFQSVILEGVVVAPPITISGGHVIFSITDGNNHVIDCAGYEPTKQFREIIRQIEPGDVVKVYGGIRKKPFTVNLEKIEVKHCVDVMEKIENPVCPVCKKHMKSKGKNQGYICRKCKTKTSNAVMKKKKRNIMETIYEVPVCARRHLSKPMKRRGKIIR